MRKILYVTEVDLNSANGASINCRNTYKALSCLGQCNLISNTRFLIPEMLSTDFNADYDLCWLRGLSSSIIVENLKKTFTVYDMNGILHEEHKSKGGNRFECKLISKLIKYCANNSDLVKVHTQNMKKYLEGFGVSADYIQIPPIIDISDYTYANKKDSYENISVGYSGSSRDWQGIPTLMDAFKLLKNSPHITLNLIGPSKSSVSANLKNINILQGCSHNIYISQILPQFDIFVVPRPSNIITETTTPIKLIEAMASGVPVIASNVGGISEYVQHGNNGYLVEPSNPEELLNAIQTLSEKPKLRTKLSKNARTSAEEIFDYQKIGTKLKGCL